MVNIYDQPSVHPTVQVLYSEILWDTLTKLCTGIKHWGSDSVSSWRIFPNLICDIFLLFVITYALCHLYGDSYEMPQCSFIERYKNYLKYSQGLLRNPEGTFLCQYLPEKKLKQKEFEKKSKQWYLVQTTNHLPFPILSRIEIKTRKLERSQNKKHLVLKIYHLPFQTIRHTFRVITSANGWPGLHWFNEILCC